MKFAYRRMLLLIVGLILVIFPAVSQTPLLDFLDVATMGDGTGYDDEITAMVADDAGNVFCLGRMSGASDVAPGLPRFLVTTGDKNDDRLFLAKYDSSHALVWFHVIKGTSNNVGGTDILLDANGRLLISGYFSEELLLNPASNSPTLTSNVSNEADGFFAKYSTDGQFLWAQKIGSNSTDIINAVAIDQQNNIYLCGAFSDTADMDPSAGTFNLFATGTFQDPFLAKYDSTGAFSWALSLEGSGLPGIARDVKVNAQNQPVIGGSCNGTVDFDPGLGTANLTTAGNLDLFLAAYSPSGAYQWAVNAGGTSEDQLYSLAIGQDDHIYATGYIQGTADLDPSANTFNLVSSGSRDVVVARYDSIGNFGWAISLGSNASDMGQHLVLDSAENLYVGGNFANTVDFDPGLGTTNATATSGDPFLASYDSTGAFRWVAPPNSGGFDEGFTTALAPSGKVYLAGTFREVLDLDPGVGATEVEAFHNRPSAFCGAYSRATGNFDSGFALEDRVGGDDATTCVTHDGLGYFYAAGFFNGGLDFDPGPAEVYLENDSAQVCFITKYDSNQQFVWVRALESSLTITPEGIATDQQGNLLLTGSFNGTVDFDPDTSSLTYTTLNSLDEIFVAKYSPSGDLIWARHLPGGANSAGYAVVSDDSNNVYVTGYFRNTVDFDPGSGVANLSAAVRDVFLLKLNSSGIYEWAFQVGGSSSDYGYDVAVDGDNQVYIAGLFRNATDFDPGAGTLQLTPVDGNAGFIAKYTPAGDVVWANQYGGLGSDEVQTLEADGTGYLYAGGNFNLDADLDPGVNSLTVNSNGFADYFALKLDTAGNTLWAAPFGSTGDDELYGTYLDGTDFYLTGSFSLTMDVNPDTAQTENLITSGVTDCFVQVLDTAGNFQNATSWGSIASDNSLDVAVSNGVVAAVGQFQDLTDFDPGPDSAAVLTNGDWDAFQLFLGDAGPCMNTLDTQVIAACDSFVGGSGMTYFSTGIYLDSVAVDSCWQVTQLELTIAPSYSDTLTINACYTYLDTLDNITLTSPGFYPHVLNSLSGCDSTVVYELFLDTSSTTVTAVACDSFAWFGNVYTSSGTYQDTLQNAAGCDSLLTLQLQLDLTVYDTAMAVGCDAYTWAVTGNTYTASGFYFDTLVGGASSGCDSIQVLNLAIDPSYADTSIETACDTFVWTVKGSTYHQSGLYSDTFTTVNGCDSILFLELTINSSFSDTMDITACDSYTWSVNGQTYEQSGLYQASFTTSAGCDSIHLLDLQLFPSTADTMEVAACDQYTWSATNSTYNQTGFYTDTLTSSQGCDSVVTLDLTIETLQASFNVENGIFATVSVPGATFRWLDCGSGFHPLLFQTDSIFYPVLVGNYAVEVTTANCIDTSECQSFGPTGVEELVLQGLRVFPNPTSGLVNISAPIALRSIRVLDVTGRLVAQYQNPGRNFEIRLTGASGLYFVEIQVGDAVQRHRIMKE